MTAAENRRRQGREAFLNGYEIFDNPYKKHIASGYEDWQEGWLDAESEKLDKQQCKDIQISARIEAKWTDKFCPKCEQGFVAKDKHGLYCCVDECGWTDENEIQWQWSKCTCHPHDLVYYGCRCKKENKEK